MAGRALEGVRVLDASGFVSGPYAATMLADLGAEVIKVEPKQGDGLRRWGRNVDGHGVVYTNCNRGKTVVALDLKSDDDRATFLTLAADADVLITNWRRGVVERLGLAEPLATLGRVVWLKISGWGPDGPLADQPAFDGSVQSRSGLAWVQGDAEPQLLRTFIADKITAAFAVQAILAALYERTRTGVGGVIDLPMLDSLAYFNFPDILQNRTVVEGQPLSARNEQTEANRPIPTRDGWIVVSPVGGRQLKATLAAIGRPDAVAELKATTTQHELTARLIAICSDVCPTRSTDAWLTAFDAHDVPAAPVLDIDAHLADPQVLHNGLYETTDDEHLGLVRRARYPARFNGDPNRGTSDPLRERDADAIAWHGADKTRNPS
jgi:crotonobetainyl-CoA:carnitine CoA-transferase CaiB-like acyl-CoA transferase